MFRKFAFESLRIYLSKALVLWVIIYVCAFRKWRMLRRLALYTARPIVFVKSHFYKNYNLSNWRKENQTSALSRTRFGYKTSEYNMHSIGRLFPIVYNGPKWIILYFINELVSHRLRQSLTSARAHSAVPFWIWNWDSCSKYMQCDWMQQSKFFRLPGNHFYLNNRKLSF